MEKLRGELWKGRAVDGKLKSSLEWPYQCRVLINLITKTRYPSIIFKGL